MANKPLEIETGLPTPPSSSATNPTHPSPWWTQLQSLFRRRNELTKEEKLAIDKPLRYVMFTFIPVFAIIVTILVNPRCHVNFSVESISVSPSSSATWWHVDFLVENPSSSSCLIYYNGDNVDVKLGSLNAAVLKTSHTHDLSGRHTSLSVDLVTEGYQSDVVAASRRGFELELKLSAKGNIFIRRYDIRCQNLTLGYEKIKCHSSFKTLKRCC